ncbi:SPW repeat protein [Streptomonospora wellingtoniae]|uniref:SPW repeat protein n=1 Tax=Streptomonospora wellingtoniae TaxID=3075544 RepID=A0ABU2KT61_9ACTN|nr:SPW repeat protein [Streptomonospora sp. DSM 45055]MDT0302288.1 SPW repeat protein [Streptomonospora sp. DSM 45055]
MRGTRRLADWTALIAGCAVVVSYAWHGMLGVGMAALFLVGILTVFLACLSIIHPELFVTEIALAVTGLLLIATPWLLSFTGNAPASWTAWICGTIAVVVGAANLPDAMALYRRIVPPQPSSRRLTS